MAKQEPTPTICVTLKLRPTCAQEATFRRWLWHLTGVHNWCIRKIETEAQARRYPSAIELKRLVVGHSQKMGMPGDPILAAVDTAHAAWKRCFRKLARKPRLRGRRRPINSIGFAHGIKTIKNGRVSMPVLGPVRFHRQVIPDGACGYARIVRRASGWYLCLFVKAAPQPIAHVANDQVGIDPGFASLITLSSGEKIDRAVELQRVSGRLAQAQRGHRRQLTARLKEREGNQRKDRNHKLSRRLVSENALIAWSKDSHRGLAQIGFGKSVASAAHGQLRQMLAYKCLSGGREFIEVPSRYSTMTCSSCGQRTGPSGRAGLKVRTWACSACGGQHDRDVNAARNTLASALGTSVEGQCELASGIAP